MAARAASKVTGKPRDRRGRPPATVEQPLTRKQELFVRELVSKDGQITLREAAINAGYAVTSAHSRAYELTNPHISPHVVAAKTDDSLGGSLKGSHPATTFPGR